MTRLTYGDPLDGDDVLVIQGEEYIMQPLGMGAMRELLRRRVQATKALGSSDTEEVVEAQVALADLMVETIVSSVRADQRERLRDHLLDRVPMRMLGEIAAGVMGTAASVPGLDPTQLAPSSAGSSPTGAPSTDGARAEVSTSDT